MTPELAGYLRNKLLAARQAVGLRNCDEAIKYENSEESENRLEAYVPQTTYRPP